MKNSITAEDFDQKFEDSKEDIIEYLELAEIEQPGYEQVKVDFPL